jgi:hypothetical protein
VSVCGTVPCNLTLETVSWHLDSYPLRFAVAPLAFTAYLKWRIFLPPSTARTLGPGLPSPGRASPHASFLRNYKRYGNINPFPIDYAFQPRLRGRLTLGKITLTLETLGFRRRGISPLFSLLIPAFSLPSPPAYLTGTPSSVHGTLPYQTHPSEEKRESAASVLCLAPLHCRRMTTRPVSCYALFEGMAASKPTSWLSGQSHFLFHSAQLWDLSRRSGLFPFRPRTLSPAV